MNEKKTGRKNILVVEAALIAILSTALVVVLAFDFGKDRTKQNGEVNIDEIEPLVPVTEEPEPEAKGRIEYYDPVFGSISVPIMPDVKLHTYSWDRLSGENQRLVYESDTFRSKTGVDVSYFQGEIDWKKVKADGIDFAMIRLGFRGYGTGNIMIDDKFTENINGALEAGLEAGVYFFSQAVSVEEAKREAEITLSMLSSYQITMPVAYDLEIVNDNGSRTRDLSALAMTENARAFCSVIEEAGYEAVYYAGKRMALLKYDMSELKDFGLWYAQAEETPGIPYEFSLWQYTVEGRVDGIDTDVALNLCLEPVGRESAVPLRETEYQACSVVKRREI